MRHFYFSDVVGDGTDADPAEWSATVGPFRPSALDYGRVREFYQIGDRMLVWAEEGEHAAIAADPRTVLIPFVDGAETTTIDSNTNPEVFEWGDEGVLRLALGGLELAAGRYTARVITYDGDHPNGLVWGRPFTLVLEEV